MKLHSLRSILAAVLALGLAAFLTACGGGGAGGNPNAGGPISISPTGSDVTFYGGIPVTLTLQGGRAPYSLTSGDASILPLPAIVKGNQVTVVPNNPGVVDAGLQPGELPSRTVQINMRDSTGILVSTSVKVAQNFLTGYGVRFTPTNCPLNSVTGNITAQACAGGQTTATFQATFAGSLAGNRTFRLEVLRGNYSLRNPATGQLAQSITTTSDHTGTVVAIIEVPANVPTQLAVIRVVDVATGVYADNVFTISGLSQSQTLTAVPNNFTFKAFLTTECGTGTADFFVFDGVPPYTASVDFSNALRVFGLDTGTNVSNTNPGRFRIEAFNPNYCVDPGNVTVVDSRGGRVNLVIKTLPGDVEPPAPAAFAVGPTALVLGCGQTGSVAVVGGTGSYFAVSSNPNVSAVAGGNTVSITRAGPAGPGTGGTQSVGVAVSDGQTILNVAVTVPVSCP